MFWKMPKGEVARLGHFVLVDVEMEVHGVKGSSALLTPANTKHLVPLL